MANKCSFSNSHIATVEIIHSRSRTKEDGKKLMYSYNSIISEPIAKAIFNTLCDLPSTVTSYNENKEFNVRQHVHGHSVCVQNEQKAIIFCIEYYSYNKSPYAKAY